MSKIPDLGDQTSSDINVRYKNLATVLEPYIEGISEAEEKLTLRGKGMEKANQENASYKYYYHSRLAELNTLTKYLERDIDRVRGKLFRSFTPPHFNLDLSDRAKDKYIDSEQSYLDVHEVYLEVKEIRDTYEAIVDAFRDRGYALKNITELRVAQIEDALLD